MDKKIGCYICSGCEIGDAIDIEALAKVAEEGAGVVKTHEALCSEAGIGVIRQDVQSDGVNCVVIAACSQRAKTDIFCFDPTQVIMDRVNIREHVAWCQKPKDEDTQMMAEDYVRMGLSRIGKQDVIDPFQTEEEVDHTVLVVGGGMTGLTAAIETSKAGRKVVVLEKEAELGGFAAKMAKQFPKNAPYRDLEDTGIREKIASVEADANITVHTGAIIKNIENGPGLYDVTIDAGGEKTFRAGSIILATGWKPYDAGKLGHLGYAKCANVVTNVQMEEIAAAGKIIRPSDGSEPKSVLFVQCAGSRDPEHLPYCSAVCCRVSLKQAKYVREAYPDSKVYIVYKDLRSPGLYEEFYKQAQQDEGVFLTKGEVVSITEESDKGVMVEADDTLLGEKIKIKADMVVLATGMVPNSADGNSIRLFEDSKTQLAKEDCGEAQRKMAEENIKLTKDHEGTEILNLNYRQGPDLPVLKYMFPDSHFICFPYETQRTGIYAAGPVRAPMDMAQAQDDATGAALKAIQCTNLTSQGKAVHPRAGDQSYPDFFFQRCTQCKRCTEECPFGTLNEDVKGTPLPNPTRCRRCAICMGACPERIISFKNYSVGMVGDSIKAIEVPDEEDEKPRVLVIMCENDAYPALDIAGKMRMQYSPYVRVVPVRCLGSVNIVWIADSLSSGIDGVLLVGCKYGDDYQCHYVKGSELCNTRLTNVQETLQRLALEPERIRLEQLQVSEYEKLPGLINEFMEQIEEVGPNPYKGF